MIFFNITRKKTSANHKVQIEHDLSKSSIRKKQVEIMKCKSGMDDEKFK